MKITKTIKMDLIRSGPQPVVDAVQGDSCSRCLEFSLYEAGKPFMIPESTSVIIRYRKMDQTGGEYDTLPNGERAWTISKNNVIVTLAPQTLTFPGRVDLSVTLICNGSHLTTFPAFMDVKPVAHALTEDSQNYFYVTSILSAPNNAQVGEYLRVSAVTSQGLVTGVEAVPKEDIVGSADPGQVYTLIEQYLEENPPTGLPGADGISATHTWNGSILTITSASGTSSADLKGEKGDRGATGPQGAKGDTGSQGPKGEKGADGTGVTILGSFASESALNSTVPTGNIGDSYLVNGYLYVWSASNGEWTNVGKIQGPQGEQGEAGPQGIQGEPGPAPVRGEDYWTEEDISHMEEYIGSAVTNTFGKGTSIPSGADLDTYRTIGKYYASSNALAQSLLNCPTSQNFMMYVFVRTSDGTQSQMIIDLNGKLYLRSRSSSAWRDWVTYITKSDLTNAVTTALQEAKDSGAFKGDTGPAGPQGEKGDTGPQGNQGADGKSAYAYAKDGGYTGTESEFAQKLAEKHIDWFKTGISLPEGADLNTYKTSGKYFVGSESRAQSLINCPTKTNFVLFVFERTDGIYSQLIITLHGTMHLRSANSTAWRDWVTYASTDHVTNTVTQMLADAKENNYFGSGGNVPVKGVDYWTEADQESIVQQVITALGTPVFGTVDENNNIILSGELTSGTYTVKYEHTDGSLTSIGTLNHTSGTASYTNMLPLSTDSDGSIYNGIGYKKDVRWSNSSAAESNYTGCYLSGYIPVKSGDVVRLKNVTMLNGSDGNLCAIFFFTDYGISADYVNNTQNINSVSPVWDGDTLVQFTSLHSGYFRITASYMGSDSVVTVNEQIL